MFDCHIYSGILKSDIICLSLQSLFVPEMLPNDLPAFQKLTHLKLSKQLGVNSGGALMKFLLHLPNLESLSFSKAKSWRL